MNLSQTQKFLGDMTLEAGRIALDFRKRLEVLQVSPKAPHDIVTEADVAVEQFIIETIRRKFPDHAVFGEESGHASGNEYRWVIDPIDGTMSFLHGQPFFSISIALEHHGNVILGAVYQPAMNDLFEAAQNRSATLNGKEIHVAQRNDLDSCVVATGFACLRQNRVAPNLKYLEHVLPRIGDIRRCGSAAMDLCYVACGRFDGFWELNLNLYDIAAGAFIARQAGAAVTDFSGTQKDLPAEVICANPVIQPLLQKLLLEVKTSR